MSPVDEIFALFKQHGAGAYYGESVSMTEHMLQAAYFAQAEAAPDGVPAFPRADFHNRATASATLRQPIKQPALLMIQPAVHAADLDFDVVRVHIKR